MHIPEDLVSRMAGEDAYFIYFHSTDRVFASTGDPGGMAAEESQPGRRDQREARRCSNHLEGVDDASFTRVYAGCSREEWHFRFDCVARLSKVPCPDFKCQMVWACKYGRSWMQ